MARPCYLSSSALVAGWFILPSDSWGEQESCCQDEIRSNEGSSFR
jgi:hypothetical protein